MTTVVYQGMKGAFSYLTAIKIFGEPIHALGVPTFEEMFECLSNSQVEYAIVPIENSLIGSIYENYDLMHLHDVHIVGEVYTPITHCLLATSQHGLTKDEHLRKITKVLSHPKALLQCGSFLKKHPWMEATSHVDTAGAAEEISLKQDPQAAAIASREAASLYDLTILEEGIGDDKKNYTRFLIVSSKKPSYLHATKGSFLLTINHSPGSLVKILEQFSSSNVNLTKIESRPIKLAPFEYLFYVDIEFEENQLEDILKLSLVLQNHTQTLKILGFYPSGRLWTQSIN